MNWNTFKISEIPSYTTAVTFFIDEIGYFRVRLLPHSPFRRLLEQQERFEEAFDSAHAENSKEQSA
jgi:hypothetical protein